MPLVKRKKLDDGAVLSLWEIKESEKELLSLLSMSKGEADELACIKASSSRLRWLASRLALRSLFKDKQPFKLNKDEHGKPFLEVLNGHVSISHSGEFAACLYHPEKRVGIDIEFIRPKIFDIRKKFMKESELSLIIEPFAIESLLVCWCAKEAVYKWQGKKGLSMKDGLTIHPFSYHEKGKLTVELLNGRGTQLLSVQYQKIGEYMLAYVLKNELD